jgi:hypothetical protein
MNKKYYQCYVTRYDETEFTNPLLPSEINLVGKLASENQKVEVVACLVTKEHFEYLFGKQSKSK